MIHLGKGTLMKIDWLDRFGVKSSETLNFRRRNELLGIKKKSEKKK
jgi:hypothetical protein